LDQHTLDTTLSILLKHEADLQRAKRGMTRERPEPPRPDDEPQMFRRLRGPRN
jgi:hypothetical protein